MSASILDGLQSDDIQANAQAFSTGPALRLFFGQRPEVLEVRSGLHRGTITDSAVRDFVATLLKDLRPGVLLPHDLALGALAVACEDVPAPFAEAFLRELAETSLAEMPLGPRVAREVLALRTSPGGQPKRSESVARPLETPLPTESAQPPT
jgi:hypothetical protein